MKLLFENWRKFVNEEAELLEEGMLDQIKAFFSKAPSLGSFDPDSPPSGGWPEGSYGAFATAHGVIAAMEDQGVQVTKSNMAQAAAASMGLSTGEEQARAMKAAGPVVAIGLAIAGVLAAPAIAAALDVAAVGVAVVGLVLALAKDPSKSEKHPMLQIFQIDEQYREFLDDDVEDGIAQAFEKDFINNLKSRPEEQMMSINEFLENYLKDSYAGRTVTGDPDHEQHGA